MAEFKQKPNTGTFFPNDYKKADNHPDWKGTFVDENGKEWQVAGWNRTTKNGKEMISWSASEPYKKKEPETKPEPEPESENNASTDSEDDLPF